jgi:hypothetical protein
MKCPRRTHLFLEIEQWECKGHTHILYLVVVNLPAIVLQVVVLLSSVLMNGADVYASRMILLLVPDELEYIFHFEKYIDNFIQIMRDHQFAGNELSLKYVYVLILHIFLLMSRSIY